MSYAGKESRTYRGSAATASRLRSESTGRTLDRGRTLARGAGRSPSTPIEVETDWQHVAIFAAGAVLGAALGAGAALLLAPQTGEDTRHDLARRGRRLRTRTADAWDDLRDEFRYAAHRGRRKLGGALRHRRERRQWPDDKALDD